MILGTLLIIIINLLSTQQPGSKRFCHKIYVKHCGISENIIILLYFLKYHNNVL